MLRWRKTSMEHFGGMLGQESSKTGEDSGAAHAHLGSRLLDKISEERIYYTLPAAIEAFKHR